MPRPHRPRTTPLSDRRQGISVGLKGCPSWYLSQFVLGRIRRYAEVRVGRSRHGRVRRRSVVDHQRTPARPTSPLGEQHRGHARWHVPRCALVRGSIVDPAPCRRLRDTRQRGAERQHVGDRHRATPIGSCIRGSGLAMPISTRSQSSPLAYTSSPPRPWRRPNRFAASHATSDERLAMLAPSPSTMVTDIWKV